MLRSVWPRVSAMVFAVVLAASCGGGGGGGSGGGGGTPPSGGGSTGGGSTGGGSTTLTTPSEPTGVTASSRDGAALISFTAPSSSGGSAVSNYRARCSTAGSSAVATNTGSSSPIFLPGLLNDVSYSCTVAAINSVGIGPESASVSVTPSSGKPGAPTGVSATPLNTSASISFSAPIVAGSSPITSYVVECATASSNPVTKTANSAANPVVLIGLTNGAPYTCTVAAINSTGSGPASTVVVTPAPSSATPAGVAAFTTIDFASIPSYALNLPAYFDSTVAALDNTPAGQTPNDRIITLGRVMFYDKRMNITDNGSCSSCHRQAKGFDDEIPFPLSLRPSANGLPNTIPASSFRTPGLTNIRYSAPGTMFWDRRSPSLEAQAIEPLLSKEELGWSLAGGIPALIAKMNSTSYYPDLFNFAFGSPGITQARISEAIAQFERAIVSTDSKWDQGYAQVFNAAAPNRALDVDLPNFTPQENRGRHLYMTAAQDGGAGCSACHVPPTFTLVADSKSDGGLDSGGPVSKPPSLKNSSASDVFGHFGFMTSYGSVVDFYSDRVPLIPELDDRLREFPGGPPRRLNLSLSDKGALVEFLRTLVDPTLRADPRFSSPMVQ